MAEGGYDLDYDADDIYDDDTDDIDERMPKVPDDADKMIISNQNDSIADLRGQLRQNALDGQKQNLVKIFYDEIGKRYEMAPEKIDYNQFRISDDGKTLYWVVGDKEIRITAKQGSEFLSLSSLVKEYNRAVGSGGTQAIRQYLNLPEYNSRTKPLPKQARQALESTRNDLVNVEEHIPLKDLSSTTELQSLTNTIGELHGAVESLETSMTDWGLEPPDVANKHTQTEGLTLHELQGLDKELQSIRGELTNNLAKLTDIDKDIAKEKRKLQEAEDEISKSDITARLKNLEDERSARLEAATANKEALRGQINRIKETIIKVLKEDSTLGERLRTLFKEQGITIVSVLTAIGMIIGVIVEAVIPTSGGGAAIPSKPPSQDSAKEWVKKQLHNLAKLLANLAGKAAAALPGVIGSIVSWLLSATGKVVNWFGNNLWAVVVLVAGLLYAAAKEYISKSRK